jgi:hypothetical protein
MQVIRYTYAKVLFSRLLSDNSLLIFKHKLDSGSTDLLANSQILSSRQVLSFLFTVISPR